MTTRAEERQRANSFQICGFNERSEICDDIFSAPIPLASPTATPLSFTYLPPPCRDNPNLYSGFARTGQLVSQSIGRAVKIDRFTQKIKFIHRVKSHARFSLKSTTSCNDLKRTSERERETDRQTERETHTHKDRERETKYTSGQIVTACCCFS